MSVLYRKFATNGRENVVVLGPDGLLLADSFHPHFKAICEKAEQGDESVFALFDVATGAGRRLEELSERVSYNGKDILFDGTPVHSVIAEQIRRTLEAGEQDYKPLVRFWEKLESNPNPHSKEQAYRWLATHNFQITESGDVVGYKGVNTRNGEFVSVHASRVADKPSAYVDGEPIPPQSYVPNRIGSVVTMPRDEVVHDPKVGCHRGLHVGDWSYAQSFASTVLEVHVNPRDIVSVPTEENSRKVRACRYEVVRVVAEANSGGTIHRPADVTVTWAGDVGYKPQTV